MMHRRLCRSTAFAALSFMLILLSIQACGQSPRYPEMDPSAGSSFFEQTIPVTLRYEESSNRSNFAALPSSENYQSGNLSGKKRFYRIGGVCLMIAGTGAVVVNTLLAEAEHDKYTRSAFTENTDRFRMNIKRYELYRGIGVGLAGVGFLSFTISFTL